MASPGTGVARADQVVMRTRGAVAGVVRRS